MKHPLETLLSAAGILLLALLSCLLLPAPSLGLTLAQKLVETFHMMDLNQLYTVLFCLWFLALGAIEYLVLRWCGVAGFPSSVKPERRASVGATVVLFAVGARRLIEGPGKDAGKGLLRIKAILEADIVDPLIGVAQIAGGQQQLPFANIAPQALPLYCKNSRCRCHFEYPAWRAISSIRSG